MDEGTEPDYGLVYPLVATLSNGGEYDDHAFVAGAQFGQVAAEMEQRRPVIERYVQPGIVAQIDLAAMSAGYRMESRPWHLYPDEWAEVRLTLLDHQPQED